MKKLISVFLALLCVVFSFSIPASAEDSLLEAAGSALNIEIESSDPKVYGIVFMKGDAETMYMPATQVKFGGPGYAKVAGDYPVAIGQKFRAWKDANGNDVFPGDEVYVDTIVYLTADYSKHTTKIKVLDVLICAVETLIHSMRVSIQVIETAISFRPVQEPVAEPDAAEPETSEPDDPGSSEPGAPEPGSGD